MGLKGVPSRLGAAPRPAAPSVERKSARERGYSARWDRASRRFLMENPLCRGCEAAGRTEPAALTDHVIPHRGDMVRFWNISSWQASCRWHHDVVKQVLEQLFEGGHIGVDDLWLDSEIALEVASREAAGRGGSNP